jgi:two-component sensor histidine kinase/two-component SAPR family response regulator
MRPEEPAAIPKSDKLTILLVDDQPAKLLSLEVILGELGENIITAGSAREALGHLLKQDEVAVVVLDVVMPGLDGFELATMIREHPRFHRTAIIFVSAIQMTDPDRLRGYAVGAVDYVPVPVVPELLRAKVRVFVELYRKTRELEALNADLERRVAERTKELATAATMLRRSAEAAGFANFDISRERIHVSDNFPAFWELDHDASCDRENLLLRVHPEDRQGLSRKWSQIAETGGPYDIEFRVVRADGSIRWLQERGEGEWEGPDIRMVGVHLDVTDRRTAEERQNLLMLEVDHRSKNALAVVQSVVRLSNASSPEAFIQVVEGRVAALARAHTLLANDRWQGADILAIIEEELAPFQGDNRINLSGPPLRLIPSAVQPLSMILHELTTNSAKYGALSVGKGTVSVTWEFVPQRSELRLSWVERKGPPIGGPPNRRGFGSTLITANMQGPLCGRIEERWEVDGVTFEMWISAELVDVGSIRPTSSLDADLMSVSVEPGNVSDDETSLSGWRIAIVEDEPIVSLEIIEVVRRSGCVIIGTASNLKDAIRLSTDMEIKIDAVILDLNLRGEFTGVVAEALTQRGVPIVWITGYGALPDSFRHGSVSTLVRKPFAAGALEAGLKRVKLQRVTVPVES